MNDNFSTPKQTKRLGLRRITSSILKGSSAKIEPSDSETKLNNSKETPRCPKSRKIAQSDRKINYKDLEEEVKNAPKHVTFVTETPSRQQSSENLRQQSVSTNCRPYRLSLSKKVREKMTKKRLEFHMANEMDREEVMKVKGPTELTKEQLLAEIEIAREELKARQEHVKKVEELKQTITVWQTGFSTALQDLQQKLDPRLDAPQLLERLHIPQEMLKYIKD